MDFFKVKSEPKGEPLFIGLVVLLIVLARDRTDDERSMSDRYRAMSMGRDKQSVQRKKGARWKDRGTQ